MLSVQTNLLAQNANRNLKVNTGKNAKTTEKLSSGYKINRAADDAAGLSMSEKMRRQVRGLHQSEDNINEGVGYVQTAEGALNEVHDILQRINELSVKAANGTNTPEDREYIDQEIQQLKKEMTRIFAETTFNERKIWDYGPGEQLTYRTERAVTFTGGSSSVNVNNGKLTNANCGVLALDYDLYSANSNYKIKADKSGITVNWTGYDGNDYATDLIPWDKVEKNGNVYSFKMEDHISDPRLLDAGGNSLIDKTVSFTVNPNALPDQFDRVIESINNTIMNSETEVDMDVHTQDSKNIPNNNVTIPSVSLKYEAAYASQASQATGCYTFDGANDSFLVPSPTSGNLTVPASKSNPWVFKFNMPGIGPVTASSYSVSYYSSTASNYYPGDYETWWEIRHYSDGQPYNRSYGYTISSGTLGSVESAITDAISKLQDTAAKGGSSNGYIRLDFNLNADKAFTYGKGETSRSVGSFSLNIDLSIRDTLNSVLGRMETALNSNTVLDFHNTASTSETATIGYLHKSGGAANIKIPIYPDDYVPYDDTQNFFVQAGTESGQHISIKYEFLDLEKLGMADTNTLTQESAERAIDEVKTAMQIVSKQRSDFGAYQNRLEHAYNINANGEENTQASESVIRDTDVAEMMMEFSVNNILLQAGTSMLTQANQSKQSVLELLQ